MACFTSLGYFWTFSSLLSILWMSMVQKIDANLHQFTLTKGGCTKIKLMQKAPSNGILHQLHQNYILLKFQNLISKTWNFLLRKMKFSIKNMKFSIKNMKFSIYEICQNSSFVLFVTEFSYHMYRKNAVLNGKQKQMKPLLVRLTKIMNNFVKDLEILSFNVIFQCLKLVESFQKKILRRIFD